jgi:hypothetical protein
MRATPDFDFDLPESARMIREAAGRFRSRFTLERIGGGSHHGAHDGDILSPMPGRRTSSAGDRRV